MAELQVLFVDRDGTLIREPADEQVDALEKVELMPGVIPALLELREAGYELILVSNQDGRGSARFPEASFRGPHEFLLRLLASQGIGFYAEYICPHVPADNCECRKPGIGLMRDFLASHTLDRRRSAVVGDRETDLAFAANLGVRGLLVGQGEGRLGWPQIVRELTSGLRTATLERNTRETRVKVSVDLDQVADTEVSTGIGFFDHMLEQVARHGRFALHLTCRGDLHVDEHHTVEDTALALGAALRQALGQKRGIGRYGFVLPMDEARAQVALDLGGRPYLVFDGRFARERVGELPTELVPHFFRSLAESLGAAIHVSVEGDNAHHMIEAAFKGLGRSLRQAVSREGSELPTTKGLLA